VGGCPGSKIGKLPDKRKSLPDRKSFVGGERRAAAEKFWGVGGCPAKNGWPIFWEGGFWINFVK